MVVHHLRVLRRYVASEHRELKKSCIRIPLLPDANAWRRNCWKNVGKFYTTLDVEVVRDKTITLRRVVWFGINLA